MRFGFQKVLHKSEHSQQQQKSGSFRRKQKEMFTVAKTWSVIPVMLLTTTPVGCTATEREGGEGERERLASAAVAGPALFFLLRTH